MRKVKYKAQRCPRCETKNEYNSYRCSNCGLIFSRVEQGSNLIAKDYIKSGKSEYVVKAKGFPKDVSKKAFLLYCGFLGLFGAHNFYVGRYKKAIFMLVFGLIAVIFTATGSIIPNLDKIMSFLSFPIGIDGFFWILDFVEGVFNAYKIPVAVDFKEALK